MRNMGILFTTAMFVGKAEQRLERFQNFLEKLCQFLCEKQSALKIMNPKIVLDILSEEGWLLDLSFFVDITHHIKNSVAKCKDVFH